MEEIYVPEIIYEDSAVIVCRKPAGLATQTARVGQKDLVSIMMNHVADGKTAPYLGLINRLDQPVSGLVLLAKDPGSAAVLSAEQKSHDMVKEYQAAALGRLEVRNGYMSDYIITDSRTNTSSVTDEKTEGAKKAVLEFSIVRTETVKEAAEGRGTAAPVPAELAGCCISHITVRLITGRHHQIRLQMSHAGLPLLGDNKYGSEDSRAVSSCLGIRGLMLCAGRLSFTHPSTHKAMEFTIKSNI